MSRARSKRVPGKFFMKQSTGKMNNRRNLIIKTRLGHKRLLLKNAIRSSHFRVDEFITFMRLDGVTKSAHQTRRVRSTAGIHNDDADLIVRPERVRISDAANDAKSGIGSAHTLSQEFNGEEARARTLHEFTSTRAHGRAYAGHAVQAATDNRRIADAAWHFEREAAGRHGGGEIARGVDRDQPDRVVIRLANLIAPNAELFLKIRQTNRLTRRFPLLIRLSRFARQQVMMGMALRSCEGECARANEQAVGRMLHDLPCDKNRVANVADARDGAVRIGRAHDRGVARHAARGIGIAARADSVIRQIILGVHRTDHGGVESVS